MNKRVQIFLMVLSIFLMAQRHQLIDTNERDRFIAEVERFPAQRSKMRERYEDYESMNWDEWRKLSRDMAGHYLIGTLLERGESLEGVSNPNYLTPNNQPITYRSFSGRPIHLQRKDVFQDYKKQAQYIKSQKQNRWSTWGLDLGLGVNPDSESAHLHYPFLRNVQGKSQNASRNVKDFFQKIQNLYHDLPEKKEDEAENIREKRRERADDMKDFLIIATKAYELDHDALLNTNRNPNQVRMAYRFALCEPDAGQPAIIPYAFKIVKASYPEFTMPKPYFNTCIEEDERRPKSIRSGQPASIPSRNEIDRACGPKATSSTPTQNTVDQVTRKLSADFRDIPIPQGVPPIDLELSPEWKTFQEEVQRRQPGQ